MEENGTKDLTDTNTDFSPFSLLAAENTGIRNRKIRVLLLTYTVSETPFAYGIVLKFQYKTVYDSLVPGILNFQNNIDRGLPTIVI